MTASFDDIQTTCPNCGKVFRKTHSRHFYCSPRCRTRNFRWERKITLQNQNIDTHKLSARGLDQRPLQVPTGKSISDLCITPDMWKHSAELDAKIKNGEYTPPEPEPSSDEIIENLWKKKDEDHG